MSVRSKTEDPQRAQTHLEDDDRVRDVLREFLDS